MGPLKWDRSHDWVVRKSYVSLAEVSVTFDTLPVPAAYWVRVRRAFPELTTVSPRELRRRLASEGRLSLGVVSGMQARRLDEAAEREGVQVQVVHVSRVEYLAYDRTAASAWLIEDPTLNEVTCEAMIAAGVPTEHIEVD